MSYHSLTLLKVFTLFSLLFLTNSLYANTELPRSRISPSAYSKDAQEVLCKQLHQQLEKHNLQSRTDFLDPNDQGTLVSTGGAKANSNAAIYTSLGGNKQRFNQHTPAGSTFNGFKMTPLDDYVTKPDSHYQWKEFSQYYDEVAFDVHFLNVTSQKWLDEDTVDRSIWWHVVAVVRPLNYNETKHGIMYIDGGSNHGPGDLPSVKDEGILLASFLAISSQSIAVVVWQIPNEHIEFKDEKPVPRSRTEDAIIAYTWNHFLDHPDQPEWLLRNPMTKGTVRAMDAVEEYVSKKWNHNLEKWVICGASKRGWDTWTTAAYDQAHEKRIAGFMPMVMSFINMQKQFHVWWRNVGGWSFALKDYHQLNFTEKFDGPNAKLMADVIDPLTYFDRYADIPLMQIMASGDEFFQLSDTHIYWDKIPGEKFLLICENAEHSLISSLLDMLPSMASFSRSVIHGIKRPQVSWKFDQANNKIVMESDVPPTVAKVWMGKTFSKTRRDFRIVRANTDENPCQFPLIKDMCPQPIIWFFRHANKISTTRYEADVPTPESGWAAFFVQFQFMDQGAGDKLEPHIFTSEAMIVPDTQPFPDCKGQACRGKLI